MSEETGALTPQEPVSVQETTEQEVTATPEEKPAEKTFTQEQVNELIEKRLAKAERKAAREREKLLQMAVNGRQPEKQPEAQPEVDGAPKREDFASYEDYLEARADWKAEQKAKAIIEQRERERVEAEARKQAETKAKTWQQRLKEAEKEIEDIHEILEDSEAPLTQPMLEAITDSDIGPKIAVHLAKHPEEAERIANLSPIAQVREITKLETKLSAEPQPPKKEPSKAPDPITPVGGKAGKVSDKPSDEDSIEDWLKKREAQLRKG